jgi:hypothetical protein
VDLLHWSPAVWDREHFGRVMAVRFADWAGLAAAAGQAHGADPFDGVLCYDEATVPIANDLARLLRLPAVSAHWGTPSATRTVCESPGRRPACGCRGTGCCTARPTCGRWRHGGFPWSSANGDDHA